MVSDNRMRHRRRNAVARYLLSRLPDKQGVAFANVCSHSVRAKLWPSLWPENDRGFKTEARYIAIPTMDDAVFCYWRRAAQGPRGTSMVLACGCRQVHER